MRVNDLVMGVVMALIGAITVWGSRDFPAMPRQEFGAGTFPTLIGGLLMLLGALLALRAWRRGDLGFTWQGEASASRVFLCLAAVVAAVVGYLLLAPLLGFPVVAWLVTTLMIGWLSDGRWGLAVLVGGVATLLIWLAFVELLRVPLPLGVLERVVY